MARKKTPDKEKFEDQLARLEVIVKRLEEGELELEEALAAFEEGVSLSRRLNERLNQAEARVELLVKNAAGELRAEPLIPPRDDDGD